jgi:hypothetical protein
MSLKGDKYETTEEVKFRLENTVVTYDGQPVYISKVHVPDAEDKGEIARVYFYDLPLKGAGQKETRKYLSSKKFDLAPFPMGYVNHNGQAFFVARTPVRQNKQGLAQGTTIITDIRGQKAALSLNDLLRSQGFCDMIAGKYPSFKEAGESLGNKENSSIAISRMFAFVIDHDLEALYLLHKGIKCGLALKNDRALKVPPKFHFLKEEMEECRIPLA